ncbi:hypothetical protein GCM10011351_19040 [Paraliobacillus quinghaiensis]|uniref:DUF4097 domain-containing protein n=1 Tax=Paraliobacillus quinghaiensis TaxID=470815 RepID=A0A917TSK9_9BACI|nr:DUF4097 family beta strand repeat-containing protein [Paraliobacillus quinghaiensis]GGM33179.1 hypothetical protein GCM10011351_19040 [Paraliobacillus quinghaiensis]
MLKKVVLVACLTLVIGLMGIFTFRDRIFTIGAQENVTEEQIFNSKDINQIDIEVDVAEVVVEESQDSDIRIFLKGNVSKRMKENIDLDVQKNSNQLEIDLEREKRRWFSFLPFDNHGSLQLTIQLPEKRFEQLGIESNVGEVSVNSGEFTDVIVTTDVGEVLLQDVTSETATVTSNVGEVTVLKAVGSWDIKVDVGEVDLQLKKLENQVTVQSDVGDVSVQIAEVPTDYTLDLSSDIGEVKLTGFDYNNGSGKEIYMEKGSAEPLLEVDSDIGDITVRTP